MRLVLDANEYIFALALFRKESCESLLKTIIDTLPKHTFCISRTIIEEVRTNLTVKEFQDFIKLVNILSAIDEDILIPFQIGAKYESMGLKPADALIAAYVEWVGADALVTENRHFLTRQENLPFKVVNAENCLKMLSK